jgi:invasion protein IalB
VVCIGLPLRKDVFLEDCLHPHYGRSGCDAGEALAVHKIGLRNLFLLVTGLAAFSASATAEEAFKLPGGASSLQETYQDWSLACRSTPKVVCTVSQQQTQQNGQRVLAIELRKGNADAVSGTLCCLSGCTSTRFL